MTNSKLQNLVTLSLQCQRKLAVIKEPLDQFNERQLNEILARLLEIKRLLPLIESDIKALSSL